MQLLPLVKISKINNYYIYFIQNEVIQNEFMFLSNVLTCYRYPCRFIGILLKYNKTIEYCEHKIAMLKRSANIYLINTNLTTIYLPY
jgi:hypothetical protein